MSILSNIRGSLEVTPTTFAFIVVLLLLPGLFLAITEVLPNPGQGPMGTRKLGMDGTSNLHDQADKAYGQGSEPGKDSKGNPRWRIKSLFISPIKSCALLELYQAEIISTGFKYDRRFAFARKVPKADDDPPDAPEWTFMTQRAYPKLVLVRPELWVPDPSCDTYREDRDYVKTEGCLVVSFPWRQSFSFTKDGFQHFFSSIMTKFLSFSIFAEPRIYFRVPLKPTTEMKESYGLNTQHMKIWKDAPESLDMKGIVNQDKLEQLRVFLGVKEEFTLFTVHSEREIFKNAPRKEELGWQPTHGFTDAYPLHFQNLATIHDLSSRVPKGLQPLNPIRFRANIFITGPKPYDEDDWTRMRVGDCELIVTNHTSRCPLPNNNPTTGITKSPGEPLYNEPLKTMKKFRCIDEGQSNAVCLGMQMVPAHTKALRVRVGDEVEVLERGKHALK